MNISKPSVISFNGLWEPVKQFHKEIGVYNRNKHLYTLHKMVYHPWEEESSVDIAKVVKKNFWGRVFSLWDKFDGQHKCDIIQGNLVTLGNRIKKSDAEEYILKGYTHDTVDGIADDETFWKSYSNAAYEPFDVIKLSEDDVKEVAEQHFSVQV